jgi:hypothetical protein
MLMAATPAPPVKRIQMKENIGGTRPQRPPSFTTKANGAEACPASYLAD